MSEFRRKSLKFGASAAIFPKPIILQVNIKIIVIRIINIKIDVYY